MDQYACANMHGIPLHLSERMHFRNSTQWAIFASLSTVQAGTGTALM
jgi:hypothetical protein